MRKSVTSPGRGRRSPSADSYFRVTLLILSAATISLQIASMGPLQCSFWGFHLYAFLPKTAAILSWIILALGCAALLGVPLIWKSNPPATDFLDRHHVGTIALTTLVCVSLFWLLRSQQTLLGDALPLTIDLPKGQSFHPRQPLTMWVQQVLYRALGGIFQGEGVIPQIVAKNTVAVGSVIAGMIFVPVVCGLGRALARKSASGAAAPWLVTLVLLTQGYAVLFFGYVENYTFYTLFLAVYLLAGLTYIQRRLPSFLLALVFITSLGLHLSAAALAPSLVFLLGWGMLRREKRLDAVVGLAVAVGAFLLLDWLLGTMSPGFDLLGGLGEMARVARTSQGGGAGLDYMFTWTHIRDFVNEQFLIGPLAAFLFAPALVFSFLQKSVRDPSALFLSLAAVFLLAGSWGMSEPLLGYARDWDIFAPAGVCYCAAGLYLMTRHVRSVPALNRFLGFSLLFSFLHLAPWVWINHNETPSLERFKTLPLGYGRTEVAVGNWYVRNDQPREAEVWFKRAIDANKYNANAYSLLGLLYAREEKFEPASKLFARAVSLRRDKVKFREDYVRALLEIGRCQEALPHMLWLGEKLPENTNYWHTQGELLLRFNCKDVLKQVYDPILRRILTELLRDPGNEYKNVDAGIFLGRLDRYDEALEKFQAALATNPNSVSAIFNTASTFSQMGRQEEARPLFEKFLQLYPDHPLAAHAREQLQRFPH